MKFHQPPLALAGVCADTPEPQRRCRASLFTSVICSFSLEIPLGSCTATGKHVLMCLYFFINLKGLFHIWQEVRGLKWSRLGDQRLQSEDRGFFPSQFYIIFELLSFSFNSPSLVLKLLCYPRKQHSQPVAVLAPYSVPIGSLVPLKVPLRLLIHLRALQ